MIHEAIDAAITVGWALLAWIVLSAVFATAALYAVVAVGWWVWRGVWRAARALIPRRAPSACDRRVVGRAVALASGGTVTEPSAPTPALPARAVPTWAQPDKEAA